MELSSSSTRAGGGKNINRNLPHATQIPQAAWSFSEGRNGEFERIQRVQAAELGRQVRSAHDCVHEARTAIEGLEKLDVLIGKARELTFAAINAPSERVREQDQVEYSKVLKEIEGLAASIILSGAPLLGGSRSFGGESRLGTVDLSSFKCLIVAVQVFDLAITELTDQRELLGIFQLNKLADTGTLLRNAVCGAISSNCVVRDRTVALRLAQSVARELGQQQESSLLGSGSAANQIFGLHSQELSTKQLELLLQMVEAAIAAIARGQIEDLLEAQHSIYGIAQGALPAHNATDEKVLMLCEYTLECLCYGRREDEWAAVKVLIELRTGFQRVLRGELRCAMSNNSFRLFPEPL